MEIGAKIIFTMEEIDMIDVALDEFIESVVPLTSFETDLVAQIKEKLRKAKKGEI